MTRQNQSFATNLDAVLLWRAFRQSQNQCFVDASTPAPGVASISNSFHAFGWHGVNVAVTGKQAAALRVARPADITLHNVVGAVEGFATVFSNSQAMLTTTNPKTAELWKNAGLDLQEDTVRVLPLEKLLAQCGARPIDFLAVDASTDALAAEAPHPRPRVIVLHGASHPAFDTTNSGFRRESWPHRWGYRLAYCGGVHRFYIANEDWATLAPCFVLPPNAADEGFTTLDLPTCATNAALERVVAHLHGDAHRLLMAERDVARAQGRAVTVGREWEARLAAQQNELVRIHEAAAHAAAHIRHLNHLMMDIYTSTSWKLTRPVRLVRRVLLRVRRAMAPTQAVVQTLPPPPVQTAPLPPMGYFEQRLMDRLGCVLPDLWTLP